MLVEALEVDTEFQTELAPSNLTFGDSFGDSVALSADGNVLAVGSPGEDSMASGVNGDGDDNSLTGSGAAYVYVRDPAGTWTEQAYIKASNPGSGDVFGTAVELNSAGDTLVVGASGEDSAATGVGGEQSDDSDPGVGAAYVFTHDGGGWAQEAYIKPPAELDGPTNFGLELSMDASGDVLVVASRTTAFSGAVMEYRRDSFGSWSSLGVIFSQVEYSPGFPIDLNDSGDTLAIASPAEDSSATGVNGDPSDNSMFASGAVLVLNRAGLNTGWYQQAYIKATNTQAGDRFGRRLALSGDGDVLAVASWDASNAVGINGDGSDDSLEDTGGVYVYSRSDFGAWSVRSYVKSPITAEDDDFGTVALDQHGTTLAVGAEDADGGILGAVFLY